jgi:DNA-directed RNA polymerase subunit RPC12/RpoP
MARETTPDGPQHFGIEAEIERLLRCPACGSKAVRPVLGSYGLLGLKALGEFGSPKEVQCRHCGEQWFRAPMREIRREAQRRIDARYDQVDVENERLRRQLADYLATNPTSSAPSPADARPGREDADPRAT